MQRKRSKKNKDRNAVGYFLANFNEFKNENLENKIKILHIHQ